MPARLVARLEGLIAPSWVAVDNATRVRALKMHRVSESPLTRQPRRAPPRARRYLRVSRNAAGEPSPACREEIRRWRCRTCAGSTDRRFETSHFPSPTLRPRLRARPGRGSHGPGSTSTCKLGQSQVLSALCAAFAILCDRPHVHPCPSLDTFGPSSSALSGST